MDGVMIDSERYSHFASYDVLAMCNEKMPDMMDMSDVLFGVKVVDQVEKIKEFFESKKMKLVFPDNSEEEFGKLRDKRQEVIIAERGKWIEGMEQVFHFLHEHESPISAASRSRRPPFEQKADVLALERFILSEHWYLYADVEEVESEVHAYLTEHNVPEEYWNVDKVSTFAMASMKRKFSPQRSVVIEDTAGGIKSAAFGKMNPFLLTASEGTQRKLDDIKDELTIHAPKTPSCPTADDLLLSMLCFALAYEF